MANGNNINDSSAAEKLNAALASLSASREKTYDKDTLFKKIIPEEPDRGLFGNVLQAGFGQATKALGSMFDVLTIPGDMGSYYAYKHFGGRASTRDRATRRKMARVGDEGGFWSNIKERQEIQRDRPGAFRGEKLLTSILLDPLTYTGFGLYGKIPMAGRYLGVADRGFTRLSNKTVQGLTKGISNLLSIPFGLLSRLTTQGIEKLVDTGQITREIAEAIKGTLTGSQSLQLKTSSVRDEVGSAFGSYLDRHSGLPARNYIDDASITKNALDDLMARPRQELKHADDGLRMTREAIEHMYFSASRIRGEKWFKTLEEVHKKEGNKLILDRGKRLEINDVVNGYMHGMEELDSAASKLITHLGGNPLEVMLLEDTKNWLRRAKGAQQRFITGLGTQGPAQAIQSLANHAASIRTEEIKGGIELLRDQQAMVGGLLNHIDATYNFVWRDMLQKYMMRPMAEAVLAFPAYPLGNMVEDLFFIIDGGGKPTKWVGSLEFNTIFQGVNIPGLERLRRAGRGGVSDIAGALGERQKGEVSYLPMSIMGLDARVLGRWWMDASNQMSEQLRRGFFTQRQEVNFRRLLNEEAERNPIVAEFMERLRNLPGTNVEEYAHGLLQKISFHAGKGDVVSMRKVIEQYTAPSLRKEDMLARVRLLGESAFPSTKRILDNGINSGDYEYLTKVGGVIDQAIENEHLQLTHTIASQTEWFDSLLATFERNPPQTSADLAGMMMNFQSSMAQAQSIMHGVMDSSFDRMGMKFGAAEKKIMTEAYATLQSFKNLLEEKVPQVVRSYELAANALGVPLLDSKQAYLRELDLFAEKWLEDITEQAAHFGNGGNAVDWRSIRHQIWGPHQAAAAQARTDASKALLQDTIKGMAGQPVPAAGVDDFMEQAQNTPLSQFLESPAGNGDMWARRKIPLEQLRDDFVKMADASPITPDEIETLKTYVDDLADSLDYEKAALADEKVQALKDPFQNLADAQRAGGAEGLATQGITEAGGTGIYQHLAEHIGDIIHRMTNQVRYKGNVIEGRASVREKAQKALTELRRKWAGARGTPDIKHLRTVPPGIGREIEQQFRDKWRFDVKNGKFAGTYATYKAKILRVGKDYASAHRALPTYNQAHRDAQEAAVAWGEGRWDDARKALERIVAKTDDPDVWQRYVMEGYEEALEAIPVVGETTVSKTTNLRSSLEKSWKTAIDDTVLESKQAFTNYDDQDALDFVMKHIFPFWTYAKNIWPRMVQLGLHHPAHYRIGGPEGAVWGEDGDGYLPMTQFGVQIAPYRGLGVGRLRNAFRTEFPTKHTGAMGEVEKNVETFEKWGFWPGFPWTLGGSGIAAYETEGAQWEVGENLPPMMDAIVNTALVSGAYLGIEATTKLNDNLRLGRFRDATERRTAFSLGYDPVNMTPEQKLEVIKRVSSFSALNSTVSLLRYRPEQYQEYRETQREAIALVINVPVKELKELEDRGENIFEIRPMSPNERRTLREVMSQAYTYKVQQAYRKINIPFKTPEEQRIANAKGKLFDEYDLRKDLTTKEQVADDENRQSGLMTSDRWRMNRKMRTNAKSEVFESVRRSQGLTEEDMESVNPHIQDKMQQVYFSIDPNDYINPYNGFVEWGRVEEAQDVVLDELLSTVEGDKKLMLAEFEDNLREGRTGLEQDYLLGIQKGYMGWFSVDEAISWYADDDAEFAGHLQQINIEVLQGNQAHRYAILSGEPRTIANLVGKTPGEDMIKKILQAYQQNLRTTHPEIEPWLRMFYDIIPSSGTTRRTSRRY